MPRLSTALSLSVLAAMLPFTQRPLRADTVFIDFETLPDGSSIADGTPLTTQYPGLTFTNTTVISAGISLNEFEFPPHSGTNVVFDDGGPITIDFGAPITSFSGYFTYLEPITLAGLDASDVEVASALSAYSTNDALFGDPGSNPNEFLSLGFAGGVSEVTITGDPLGDSFTLDDVTYTTAVPEPNSVLLLLSCTGGLLALRKRLL